MHKENPQHVCSQNVFTKEEKISSQIQTEIQKVSLPDDCSDWMIKELENEKSNQINRRTFSLKRLKNELSKLDEKLEKLMTAYLENVLSLTEYQEAKNVLVNQKQVLKDKIVSFERESNNRFELSINFIKASKQAKIIALQENPERIRDFLKKIGSNFLIQNQNISFSPRGAWLIVAKSGLGARSTPFAESAESVFADNSPEILNFQTWRRVEDLNL